MVKRVDSISISPNKFWIQITESKQKSTHQVEDNLVFSLYRIEDVPFEITLSNEGVLSEERLYKLSLLTESHCEINSVLIVINGEEYNFVPASLICRTDGLYEIELKMDGSLQNEATCLRFFLLTYGLTRISLTIFFQDDLQPYELSTKDIPTYSQNEESNLNVQKMLEELLDTEPNEALNWMFRSNAVSDDPYTLYPGGYLLGAPKSINSFLQLLESILEVYARNYEYFRLHGFSRVRKVNKRVDVSKIRELSHHEVLWIGKNTDCLNEVVQETAISYNGQYYLPHKIETVQKVKSFDSYENQIVLGFLENNALVEAKKILRMLKKKIVARRNLRNQLREISENGYYFPAMVVVDACYSRQDYLIKRLECLVSDFSKYSRLYKNIFKEVPSVRVDRIRRSKVFEEINAYSEIYTVIVKWFSFGEFSLCREDLAMQTLRVDKLYEYFCLYKLLSGLSSLGFKLDSTIDCPVKQYRYALNSRYYKNEVKVANSYSLRRDYESIEIYYQPVIYGDNREENNICVHRTTKGKPFGKYSSDSFWWPDFLLKVHVDEQKDYSIILDAKYSHIGKVTEGYPKYGILTEEISKYKSTTSAIKEEDRIQAVWLLCGKETKSACMKCESSLWARDNFQGIPSGVGALTPENNCLQEMFDIFLQNKKIDDCESSSLAEGDETHKVDKSISESSQDPKDDVNREESITLKLAKKIFDKKCLLNTKFCSKNFRINRPILRTSKPSNAERKFYIEVELNSASYFCYVGKLNQLQENLVKKFIAKNHID